MRKKSIPNTTNTPSKHIHIVIGPTASGKSEYAIRLAKKYNGEIISADSRQVYRGLDIGTGKVEGKWTKLKTSTHNLKIGKLKIQNSLVFLYKGIPHHCIDFVNPKKQYSVSDFKRDGEKTINDILSRGKTPIICGGTGQYVDALILNNSIPEVPPNKKFRKLMEKKSTKQLFALLQKKDPARASTIDPYNPRRLIRALEIIHATGKPIPVTQQNDLAIKQFNSQPIYNKIHYLNPPREQLYKRIEKRLQERIYSGMLKEVTELRKQGISWKRLDDFGLEYRYVSRYIKSLPSGLKIKNWKLEIRNFLSSPYYTQLFSEIKKYSKRQKTWFRKYEK